MTGLAVPLVGAAYLLADALALFAPVLGMVAGIGANHERLKLWIAALEQRVAQAEWRDGVNRGGATLLHGSASGRSDPMPSWSYTMRT